MENRDIYDRIMALHEITGASAPEMAKACGLSVHTYNKRKGAKYEDHYFIENNYVNALNYFKGSLKEKLKQIETLCQDL